MCSSPGHFPSIMVTGDFPSDLSHVIMQESQISFAKRKERNFVALITVKWWMKTVAHATFKTEKEKLYFLKNKISLFRGATHNCQTYGITMLVISFSVYKEHLKMNSRCSESRRQTKRVPNLLFLSLIIFTAWFTISKCLKLAVLLIYLYNTI